MSLRWCTTLIALPLLAACGTSGSNPCKPPEANFSVQGTNGTPYKVVGFNSGDTPAHVFMASAADLLAPHTFYLINTNYPVTGSFVSDPNATEDVPVFLRSPDLESVIATGVIAQSSDVPITLNTGPSPIDCPVAQSAIRIRVEMFTETTGAFDVPFVTTVGDENNSFLACGLNRVCSTPTTIYFDNAQNSFDAIITKSIGDTQVVDLQVYVDEGSGETLRGTDRATQDNRTAKVHVEF